jgi:AcrR family transcriptional regulator
LLESASELFAARGPSRVTVREIAESAGVNHGQVHHYFGSKDGLLRAVLDGLARRTADELAAWDGSEQLFAPGGATERHGRIVAHLLLDGRDPKVVQTEFPVVRALVGHLRSRGMTDHEARRRAAQASALVFGWQLFQPFLVTATGLDAAPDTDTALLSDGVQRVLRGDA